MRDLTFCFDLSPPATTVAKTNAVFLKGLRDDDVLHLFRGEMTVLSQICHSAITAGFFIGSTRDFDGTTKVGVLLDERFRRNDRRGQAPLHITGTTPVDVAICDFAAKGINRPTGPDLNHIGVAVEVNTIAQRCTIAPRNDVPTGVAFAVTWGVECADQLCFKPRGL